MVKQEKKVKIALVGVGGFGSKLAETITKTKNLKLSAIYDKNHKDAQEASLKYQCKAVKKFETLLADKQIKGIILATPNHLHPEQVIACLKNNKHIFVEKPISNTLKEAREIIKAKKNKKLVLMVGHNLRRNNAIRKMKTLIDNGKIGKLVSGEINMSHSGGMKQKKENWRYYQKKCPGGPLIMLGSHSAEVSNYLFGPAKKVASIIKKQYAPTQTGDTSLILIELKSGPAIYICNNYNTPGAHFIKVYGTKGILDYNRNLGTLTFQGIDIDKRPAPLKKIKYKQNDIILEEMEEFGNCILKNKTPETGFKEAFNALSIIEAALTSQKENRFINLKNV